VQQAASRQFGRAQNIHICIIYTFMYIYIYIYDGRHCFKTPSQHLGDDDQICRGYQPLKKPTTADPLTNRTMLQCSEAMLHCNAELCAAILLQGNVVMLQCSDAMLQCIGELRRLPERCNAMLNYTMLCCAVRCCITRVHCPHARCPRNACHKYIRA